jgi:hypothetical protein
VESRDKARAVRNIDASRGPRAQSAGDTPMQSRSAILDAVKGMAIFGVVFIHTAGYLGNGGFADAALIDFARAGLPLFCVFSEFSPKIRLRRTRGMGAYLHRRVVKRVAYSRSAEEIMKKSQSVLSDSCRTTPSTESGPRTG